MDRAQASTALEHPGPPCSAAVRGRAKNPTAYQVSPAIRRNGTVHGAPAMKVERTLDVQYFLFQQDDTGKLVLQALLEAADRGVRVRLLIDDAEAFDVGSAIRPLAAHANIEIRIFNPFVVRRELSVFRWAEFVVGGRRLNYRCTTSSSSAITRSAVTGRLCIGDAYFQRAPRSSSAFRSRRRGPMVRGFRRASTLLNDKPRRWRPCPQSNLRRPSSKPTDRARRAQDKMAAPAISSASKRTPRRGAREQAAARLAKATLPTTRPTRRGEAWRRSRRLMGTALQKRLSARSAIS